MPSLSQISSINSPFGPVMLLPPLHVSPISFTPQQQALEMIIELIDEIWDKEGMIISDVYPDQVSSIRENNPLFKGQHPDVYHYR